MLTLPTTSKSKAFAAWLAAAVAGTAALANVASAYPPAPTGGPVPAPAPMEQPAPQRPVALLNGEQLDELLAPIALYSDPLIAEVLPAATYPDELAAAAAWLQYNRNPTELAIDSQPWEPPIRALAHSPSVLIWMAENGDWTRALGTAFTYQGREVMDSIQRLRGEALAAGTLINTPQQVVVYQGSTLCIEPADPGVLYVPVYDWHEAYRRGYRPDAISFFVGSRIGGWLDFDFDWDHRSVVEGARWDHGWDHRWDDDRNAHPVTIRDTVRIEGGNTPPRQTTREVRVGGTEWKRNDAKPAPSFPASITPAKPELRVVPGEKTPAAPPEIKPQSQMIAPKAPPVEHTGVALPEHSPSTPPPAAERGGGAGRGGAPARGRGRDSND